MRLTRAAARGRRPARLRGAMPRGRRAGPTPGVTAPGTATPIARDIANNPVTR